MGLEVGQRLPEATLLRIGEAGPESVQLSEFLAGRKVILFGLPGAFTRTCSSAHLPSFIRTAADFQDAGVDEIACIAVNDPFVMKAWSDTSGAGEAGVAMLGDGDGAFTKAIGMDFDAPQLGFHGRSNRYAILVEDGVVTMVQIDEPGVCEVSTGEKMLDAMKAA